MGWLFYLSSLAAAYVCYNLFTLFQNYQKARESGLPIVILPIPYRSPFWLLLCRPLRPFFKRVLSEAAFEYLDIGIFGWEFRSRGKALRLSKGQDGATKSFVFCNCSSPNVYFIGEPELAFDILKRAKDFEPSDDTVKFIGVFGPALAATKGEQWAKQRRVIAPQLNEQYSRIVFDESQRQAGEMLDHIATLPGMVTEDTLAGLRRIAINVLIAAGYGMSQPWGERSEETNEAADLQPRMKYVQATRLIIHQFMAAVLLPPGLVSLPIFPESLRRMGRAVRELPNYAKDMVAYERKRIGKQQTEGRRGNFLEMLLRQQIYDDVIKANSGPAARTQLFSEDEVSGNLFGFTIAGFETTANTLGFAVTLLAAKPEWQEWLIEEIDDVLRGKGKDELIYSEIYPRLTRCLAVMHETLRLFNPVVHVAKQPSHPVTLQTSNKTYHIQQDGEVYINQCALQADPEVWGPDALDFKPSRWLSDEAKIIAGEPMASIPAVPNGSFLPWSSGPRVCPGMKFSQVEFVSVVMAIFRKYRIEPVLKKGESRQQACDGLYALAEGAQHRFTLEINHPKEVNLRYVER